MYVNPRTGQIKRVADIRSLHMQGNMLLFVHFKSEHTFQYIIINQYYGTLNFT
jgi:hypothetical protein